MINGTICLFDLNGTLTRPSEKIDVEMLDYLKTLRMKIPLALVCGSPVVKVLNQIRAEDLNELFHIFDYVFTENGLVSYLHGKLVSDNSVTEAIGDETLQQFINFCLFYMSKLKLPFKRGTFIDVRRGLVNICPVGKSCTVDERYKFAEFDKDQKILRTFAEAMSEAFPPDKYGLNFAVGGQISINVHPVGWDKTFCLQFLRDYQCVHFFGNKTEPGGNDHEIYADSRTIGHTVNSPEDTLAQLIALFNEEN